MQQPASVLFSTALHFVCNGSCAARGGTAAVRIQRGAPFSEASFASARVFHRFHERS